MEEWQQIVMALHGSRLFKIGTMKTLPSYTLQTQFSSVHHHFPVTTTLNSVPPSSFRLHPTIVSQCPKVNRNN